MATNQLRSRLWFDDPNDPGATALYIERYMNFGLTREELQSGKPIVGIAQTGSDLSPCNRIHQSLAERMRAGIREAGGVPLEFPVHPIQETGRRPTAAIDRNLAYLGLVEILHGYPLDGVILTTGCDKTTPAMIMAAATANLPAISINGGPMLNGWYKGRRVGSGTILWEARRLYAAGEIGYDEFIELVASSAPSPGHCNTMGTASTMNTLAEALGMSLPGSAAPPAPHKERAQYAFETGLRIVGMIHENLTPDRILTRAAFENAIAVNTVIGGSTNAPIHINAIARHMGVNVTLDDWQALGYELPLLVNVQPAGEYLAEDYHRAGGAPAVMGELLRAGKLNGDALAANGRTVAENVTGAAPLDEDVIRPFVRPLMHRAGFAVMGGNLFDAAIMKTSVISDSFRARFLETEGDPDAFEGRAIVFDGPEDYHARIDDPSLDIDDTCILVMRGTGPVGYPGSAEVVNMQPPAALIRAGIHELPTIGDGRQSGTSGSPSILNASPESAAGGNLAILQTGDRLRVDIRQRRVDILLTDAQLAKRRADHAPPALEHHTPWEELYRAHVGQLADGGCLEFATGYRGVTSVVPRHSH